MKRTAINFRLIMDEEYANDDFGTSEIVDELDAEYLATEDKKVRSLIDFVCASQSLFKDEGRGHRYPPANCRSTYR